MNTACWCPACARWESVALGVAAVYLGARPFTQVPA